MKILIPVIFVLVADFGLALRGVAGGGWPHPDAACLCGPFFNVLFPDPVAWLCNICHCVVGV
jgi:hypothetical protein